MQGGVEHLSGTTGRAARRAPWAVNQAGCPLVSPRSTPAGRVPHLSADLVERGVHWTTWNGSKHRSAFWQRSATTLAIHSAASALTRVILAHRSSPRRSKNFTSVFGPGPGGPTTTRHCRGRQRRPGTCGRDQEISSIPIRRRLANRSVLVSASATTRVTIDPRRAPGDAQQIAPPPTWSSASPATPRCHRRRRCAGAVTSPRQEPVFWCPSDPVSIRRGGGWDR